MGARSRRRWTRATALSIWAMLAAHPPLAALGITVTGSWSQTIGPANLVSGAGSDLANPYVSGAAQIILSFTGIGSKDYHVTVQRVDTSWNSNLNLYVQRTSAQGNITGGATYMLVTTTAQTFFNGAGNPSPSNVNVQVKLDGVSLQVPPAAYTTGLTFTVLSP